MRCYRFPFNNQPDALFIQIYSVIKLYMFRASSVPIIRSYLLYTRQMVRFMQVMMTASKQSQDGTQFHPDSARNMQSFMTE